MARAPMAAAPPTSPPLRGWRQQVAIVLLGLSLWTLYPHASLGALVLAYGAAWLVLGVLAARDGRFWRWSLSRPQAVLLALALCLAPAAHAVKLADRFLENEALDAIDHYTDARLRLEALPSIAPPLVAADRPQTFYVHAPDAERVTVRLGEGGPRLESSPLGHGLFRVLYDPARDGSPVPADGPLEATIEVDGASHARAMDAVTTLAHPRWLAPSPDRTKVAAVSEETDELFVATERGLSLRATVGDGPTDVRFLSETSLVVSHRYADTLRFVDLDRPDAPETVVIGPHAQRLALDPARSLVAVALAGSRPEVALVSSDRELRERIPLSFVPDWIAFGEGRDTLVVSSVRPPALHRFERGRDGWSEDRPPLPLGRPAVALAPSPDGSRLVVAVTDYVPDGRPHLGNHFVQDQVLDVDVATWRVVARRLTATRSSRQESPGNVDRGVSPMGIDVLEDGSRWVAFAGTDEVSRLESGQPIDPVVALDEHPVAAPFSAVGLANGRVAVSSPIYGTIAFFSPTGRRTALVRLAPDDHTLLREDERALQRRIGERTFYESTRAGVSCQSCHLHTGSDGARHNIGGSSFVATLDTRGLAGTPPYLRDGGYPLLGSLDDVAQTLYRGYRRRQGGRRVSLDRYLAALPRAIPTRQLEARDEARERRGLDAFVRARCPLCHSFPAFTNLGQHPAEALFPDFATKHEGTQLDTPSLVGLDRSAPYLVDGRAETLEAIFADHDPAHRHGDTEALDEAALADLVYFLEGL